MNVEFETSLIQKYKQYQLLNKAKVKNNNFYVNY